MRRTIVFEGRDGKYAGKVRVRTGGGRGNKHFGRLQPDGPLCPEPGCGAPFSPICSSDACEGHRIPRNIMRVEVGWEPRERREPRKGGGRRG